MSLVFQFGKMEKLCDNNPCKEFRVVAKSDYKAVIVTPEQAKTIIRLMKEAQKQVGDLIFLDHKNDIHYLRSTARIPSSASTFIALAPLQPLRKSPRRSSSASVSGSFWAKVFTGSLRASSITVYDTTFDWLVVFDSTALPSEPLLPFRLASSPEYRLCGRSLWTAMPKVHHPEIFPLSSKSAQNWALVNAVSKRKR
jgi:hypothetical protein